jgi:CheY-like chemotaxis protein
MARAKVLVVDDREPIRLSPCAILDKHAFDLSEALRFIHSQKHDALLSDLHMPRARGGLTAVSAFRHANPEAVTLQIKPKQLAAASQDSTDRRRTTLGAPVQRVRSRQ